jgi:hypothetical protein
MLLMQGWKPMTIVATALVAVVAVYAVAAAAQRCRACDAASAVVGVVDGISNRGGPWNCCYSSLLLLMVVSQ